LIIPVWDILHLSICLVFWGHGKTHLIYIYWYGIFDFGLWKFHRSKKIFSRDGAPIHICIGYDSYLGRQILYLKFSIFVFALTSYCKFSDSDFCGFWSFWSYWDNYFFQKFESFHVSQCHVRYKFHIPSIWHIYFIQHEIYVAYVKYDISICFLWNTVS